MTLRPDASLVPDEQYQLILAEVSKVLEEARRVAARTVNAVMTATYWEVGRRIVEHEQRGEHRAEYGKAVLKRLSADLSLRFGRGFGTVNLHQMRLFYLGWPLSQTLSANSQEAAEPRILQTASEKSVAAGMTPRFPLPWSHYVRLMTVKNPEARAFYEAEALRGGWTVRQLTRQIDSQFYERAALSRNKAAMLAQGGVAQPSDAMTAQELVRDPFVLEFLDLKDEYSEHDLEEALILHLESFLLELGGTSPSSGVSGGCVSETSGSGWTCSSSTAACAASWSSTSSSAPLLTLTQAKCTCT